MHDLSELSAGKCSMLSRARVDCQTFQIASIKGVKIQLKYEAQCQATQISDYCFLHNIEVIFYIFYLETYIKVVPRNYDSYNDYFILPGPLKVRKINMKSWFIKVL